MTGGQIEVATGPDCDGPWTAAAAIDRPLVRVVAQPDLQPDDADRDGLLQVCGPSRDTWYDGEIWATEGDGRQRTINLVSVDQYLRGVVPNEVPASWPEAALEAQAVAARSYVLAGDTRWTPYADTCDSTLCQVYDGRYTTRNGFREANHPRTDDAIEATTGVVRLKSDGSVARTEFSSSTGGWTAGGDFPAVIDEGDAVTDNPNARWEVTVGLDGIEQSYGRGDLLGIGVVERNGLGPDGGRALEVELRFASGSVTVDGDTVRRQFGLRSNWFTIGDLTRDGVVQEPIDTQLISRYVDAAYAQLAGRQPNADEVAASIETVRAESRYRLALDLVRGAHFSGGLVDDLYRKALGREPDGPGRQYWVDTMAAGLKYEHLGTLFYGSPEYVNRS
ncbi:MAG: SpoIID/LytB domain-containing protein, partial [Actinomycetota bacterium]